MESLKKFAEYVRSRDEEVADLRGRMSVLEEAKKELRSVNLAMIRARKLLVDQQIKYEESIRIKDELLSTTIADLNEIQDEYIKLVEARKNEQNSK